jgi:Asp-tRNA(Asn)/Glu-tRNA(Gln) amidotransferase A subunit family amidase
VLPYIREWIAPAAGYSAAQVFHGFSQIGAMREAAVAACQPFDFVLSPVSPVPTFPAEWAGPTNDPARALEHICFTVAYNMSEQPAASVDCGRTRDGLPIGLQIAGRRHDDLGVLRLARAWERLRPAPVPWPQPPA